MKSQAELEKLVNDVLEPYATELGHLLHDWNDLHSAFTFLFLAICQEHYADKEQEDLLLSVWNSIPNDRMQRNMLRQAAKSRYSRIPKRMEKIGIEIDVIKDNEKEQLDGILWALDSADYLGRKRDDSAHMPVILFASDNLRLMPNDGTNHPIAESLRDKDILAEFNLIRGRVRTVQKYVWSVWSYLVGGSDTWPRKPEWPTSPHPSGHKVEKGQLPE